MKAGDNRPSWQLSLLCLVILGALFYGSYGFSNWLASRRADVPSVVFGWEKHVMFVAWTIVPYWTTNLFYAASFFLCRTRDELFCHVKRLVTAQVISVTCFILFPLAFSWQKPDTSGAFGFLYDSLALFDKPFNQAPSLHVALTVILGALYLKILPRFCRLLFCAWSALVIVSVMTTYQHHFLDIPTGFLLGAFCVWLWPDDGHRRAAAVTRSRRRMVLASLYALAALLLAWAALYACGWSLWLLWPAVAALAVANGYFWLGTEIFDKREDGTMAWPTRVILAPYRFAAHINSRIWTRAEPRVVEISDGVYLGRFPAASDIAKFTTVIDLTCEFPRARGSAAWICVPMLDLAAPDAPALGKAADAIEQARSNGLVLVVCALGYGRSVAVMAAWLLRSGRAKHIGEALSLLRTKRPRMRLSQEQMDIIGKAQHENRE